MRRRTKIVVATAAASGVLALGAPLAASAESGGLTDTLPLPTEDPLEVGSLLDESGNDNDSANDTETAREVQGIGDETAAEVSQATEDLGFVEMND